MAERDNKQSEEHILHFWQPFHYEVKRGHDYLRNSTVKCSADTAFRTVLQPILQLLDRSLTGYSVAGRENLRSLSGGAVTVCNHIHQLDCTMIDLAVYPKKIYYVTLESNFRIPVVRHIIKWLRAVPLSANPSRCGELFASLRRTLADGNFVQIYPEAVLDPYYRGLRGFHEGAFRLAVTAGVPVVPMVIKQYSPEGIHRIYKKKPCLKLIILPPLYPKSGLGKRESALDLAGRCRKAMENELKQN